MLALWMSKHNTSLLIASLVLRIVRPVEMIQRLVNTCLHLRTRLAVDVRGWGEGRSNYAPWSSMAESSIWLHACTLLTISCFVRVFVYSFVLWCEKSPPWQQASSHQWILLPDTVLWIAMSRSHRLHGHCAVCTCRTRAHTPGVGCTPCYCIKYLGLVLPRPVLDRCCCLEHSLQFAIFWTWNILLTDKSTF